MILHDPLWCRSCFSRNQAGWAHRTKKILWYSFDCPLYGKYIIKTGERNYRYGSSTLTETKFDADLTLNLSVQSCKLHKESISILANLSKDNPADFPIYQRIRYARLTAGISATELFKKLNIDRSTMSKYENNLITIQGMDVKLLKDIAIACGQDKHFCMDDYHIFKDNSDTCLKIFMQENNLTNQAFAEMLNVSVTTIKNWKKKKSCPSYQLWQTTLHGLISAVLSKLL